MKPVVDTHANHTPALRHYLGEHEMRYIIDGVRYKSAHKVYRVAVEQHGYTGPESRFCSRVTSGISTWRELLAPGGSTKGSDAMRAKREASRIECARIAEAMDARKAAMSR